MRQHYPVLQIEKLESLTDISLNGSSTTISQDKIRYRRKRINRLRLRGYTNQQIANQIGCNLSTIEKDLHDIRELSRQWYEEDSITEYCQSLHDSIILYDNAIEDLHIMYQNENEPQTKITILNKITEFEEKKTIAYEKTKSVQSYLRCQLN